jgi:ABC-2 type transport system permease protein
MRRYGRLWLYLARRSAIAQLAYRGDFLMGLARNVASIALAIVFLQVLFLRTDSIAGWSQPAVLLLFGTFRLVKGLLYFFAEDTVTAIPEILRRGEMDFVLLKPVGARFLLTCAQINLGAVSNAAIGGGLVLYGLRSLPAVSQPVAPLAYLALVACAVVIFYNALFMLMTVSFWASRVDSLQYLFDELLNMAGLPVSVYRGVLGVLFSYVIPLGVAATVPAAVLTGRADTVFIVYAPLCAIATSLLSQWLWRRAVGSYTSAGG